MMICEFLLMAGIPRRQERTFFDKQPLGGMEQL